MVCPRVLSVGETTAFMSAAKEHKIFVIHFDMLIEFFLAGVRSAARCPQM
jgi:hypothetical protein